jgi:hypothetical protein
VSLAFFTALLFVLLFVLPQHEKGAVMNFAIGYTRNPAFLAFKKAIGHDSALEFFFKLVERCQSEKTTEHYLPDDYIVAA